MSRVVLVPRSAWMPDGALSQACFTAPGAGRLVVWAAGADEAARLHRADSDALGFAVLGGSAFVGCVVAAGEVLRITAPAPPQRCLALLRAPDGPSPSLGTGWPRAVSRTVRPTAPEPVATRARMDAALAAHDLDAALAALADMLLLARAEAATQDAVAALLRHLSRHPMLRGAALGALVAALIEVPA